MRADEAEAAARSGRPRQPNAPASPMREMSSQSRIEARALYYCEKKHVAVAVAIIVRRISFLSL